MNRGILVILAFVIVLAFVIPESFADSVTVSTDKKFYTEGENVILIGTSENHKGEILEYNIFNGKNEKLLINENGDFTKTILNEYLDTGRYVIQIFHPHNNPHDYTHKVETDFKYGLENLKTITDDQYVKKIKFSTYKKLYNADEKITFSGKAPKDYVWNEFRFSVTNSKGVLVATINTPIDKYGNFNGTIPMDNFKINGKYKIELQDKFTNSKFSTSFEYKDPNIIDIVSLDKEVKEIRVDLDSLQIQFNNFQKMINSQLNVLFNMFNQIRP